MVRFDEICFPVTWCFFWKTCRFFTIILGKKKHVYKQHSEFIFYVFFGTNELVALFLANWNEMQVLHIFSRIHLPHLFTSTRWSFTQRICPWYSAMSAENIDQHNVRWKMWYLRGDIVITSFLRSSRNKSYMCSLTSGPTKHRSVWLKLPRTVGKASLLLNFKFIEEEFWKSVGEKHVMSKEVES